MSLRHLSSINTTGWHRLDNDNDDKNIASATTTAGPIMTKSVWDADYDAPRALVFFTHWQLLREEIFSYYSIVTLIQ